MSERPGCAGGSPGGPPGGHPVVDALRTVRTALAGVVEDRCWSLADEQVSAAVDEVQAAVAQLEELRLRLLATASSRDAGFMATSTAGWLAAHQRISRREAARAVRLGAALDGRYGQLRAALAGGAVNPSRRT